MPHICVIEFFKAKLKKYTTSDRNLYMKMSIQSIFISLYDVFVQNICNSTRGLFSFWRRMVNSRNKTKMLLIFKEAD